MSKLRVLFTGATGYIGGSVLAAILDDAELRERLTIVALHRREEDRDGLQALGVETLQGDLVNDQSLITDCASGCDVIVDVAHSDMSVSSILEGARRRATASPELSPMIYVHTSGTGVLSDDSQGQFEGGTFYDDSSVEDMKSIPENAWHRDIDLSIYAAVEEGVVHGYLILPALVFGTGTGAFRTESEQIPELIDLALARGQAGQVGAGKSIRGSVHVQDLCSIYILLLKKALGDKPPPTGYQGTFIGASGHHSWGSLSQAIGGRLHELGLVKTFEVSTFDASEMAALGANAGKRLGSNSRPVASRASRDLGWTPIQGRVGQWIQSDIDYHLRSIGKLSGQK